MVLLGGDGKQEMGLGWRNWVTGSMSLKGTSHPYSFLSASLLLAAILFGLTLGLKQ
jgi:hypothetical protein